MESGFVKANSSNLPRIDLLMLGEFLASNNDFCSSEFRNVKTSLSNSKSGQSTANSSGFELISATLKVLVEPKQLMLVSINVFVGMQQAFFGADFTAAFVSCSIGIGSVGFVMMNYGLGDAIGSVLIGQLAEKMRRLALMVLAYMIHAFLLVLLFTWSPKSHQAYVIYIIAVLWGLCDSIWVVQISALYGILFSGREEAAFSNVRFSESIGCIVTYLISSRLQTRIKTYILLATMTVGMVFYLIVEYKESELSIITSLHLSPCNDPPPEASRQATLRVAATSAQALPPCQGKPEQATRPKRMIKNK